MSTRSHLHPAFTPITSDDSRPPLPPGTRLGRYELTATLGQGKYGVVYRALHAESRTAVAIKTASRLELRDLLRLRAEARTLGKIHDRHVVALHEYVRDSAAGPLLVMEYLPGMTLLDRLLELAQLGGRLPQDRAVQIGIDVISGAMAAHAQGIVHCDLKLNNVLLVKDGAGPCAKIIDFGLARDREERSADLLGLRAKGAWGWMAPEQMRGRFSELSDQYAIGAILFSCLTSYTPFPAKEFISEREVYERAAQGNFSKPREFCPELPEALEAIVLRAMAPDPADRFPDLGAMKRALVPFAV
jgi:eukaryotic-like serine/threonine-protein kinase